MNIPIFPLPIFLLPEGITRLKIFEQRYLQMVKIAMKNNGFAIILNELLSEEAMTASWVDIIDFSETEKGILIIDVKCKSLVTIAETNRDDNNLLWATAKPVQHWSPTKHSELTTRYSRLLHTYFKQNHELSALYHNEFIDLPYWVVARWLELLPISEQEKICFFDANSYQQAELFLATLLADKNFTLM